MSGEFAIYKGKGAAQFRLLPPIKKTIEGNRGPFERVEKNGAILLEAAPGLGKGDDGNLTYDWEKKISFAIGINDIAQIFNNPDAPPRLIHVPGGNPGRGAPQGSVKTLEFVPGEGQYAGTYMLKLSLKEGDQFHGIQVPLTGGEWFILTRLMVGAVPQMLGWTA